MNKAPMILKRSNHFESELNLKSKVQGQYTLVIRDAETGKIKRQLEPFNNLITDFALNLCGTVGFSTTFGYVGTGTNPAAASDTNMGVFKVGSSDTAFSTITATAPSWYYSWVVTVRYGAGVITGNITEVGIGRDPAPLNNLWSRALIVDGSGNPVTLTILPNEILDVIYTLRYYPPGVSDFTGSFALNGVTYNYNARLANAASTSIGPGNVARGPAIEAVFGGASSVLGPVTGEPTGVLAAGGTTSTLAYTNGSYTANALTSFSLSQGNIADGGIQCFKTSMAIGSSMFNSRHQFQLDQKIPKTNMNTMSFTMSQTFGRYTGPL